MQEKLLFLFAVIADTHIRMPESSEESGYPSNRLSNDRAKYVVQCFNRIKLDYLIHLGDLVRNILSCR
jgi:metallophosphoesterase superfamily enzyme